MLGRHSDVHWLTHTSMQPPESQARRQSLPLPARKRSTPILITGAVLGIFIWVGQSKAKRTLGRPAEVVYVGIMGMTRAVWVGQERVWVGRGLPGLIARTASESET